jgi:protein-L-isoaspartate O-methyltransferase
LRLNCAQNSAHQELVVIDKDLKGQVRRRTEFPVMFVPMVPARR